MSIHFGVHGGDGLQSSLYVSRLGTGEALADVVGDGAVRTPPTARQMKLLRWMGDKRRKVKVWRSKNALAIAVGGTKATCLCDIQALIESGHIVVTEDGLTLSTA